MRAAVTTVAVILLALVGAVAPAFAEDAAGWRIYRDPATDQTTAPPPGMLPAAAARSVATAAAPALREQLTADGSAAFIDLHGRFRAALRAERGADSVAAHCAQARDANAAP